MKNQWYSLLLTSIFCISLLRPVLPFVEYAINFEYIKEVLCINKATPEMHCDGKCYLSKLLVKASDSNSKKDRPFPEIDFERLLLFCPDDIKEEFVQWQWMKKETIGYRVAKILNFNQKPPSPPPKLA